MDPIDMQPLRLCSRIFMLIVGVALTACTVAERGHLVVDDLSYLKPSSTSYDEVISRYGQPLRKQDINGEIRATYTLEEQSASLSNIDGKGFVRGVGGFVNTYPSGSQEVTLVFDAKTRMYKKRQWDSMSLPPDPQASPE
jgi:hypothetical protein